MRCALPSPGVRVSTSGRATRERRLRSLHVRCSSSSDQTAKHVLTFVTGNQGKVDRLRLAMSLQAGCASFEVDGIDLALHEIQADTVLEVALARPSQRTKYFKGRCSYTTVAYAALWLEGSRDLIQSTSTSRWARQSCWR